MGNNALAKRFTPVSILGFAVPNIIMMLFLSLYTIVDGIFISRFVGTLALSAVNMCDPLFSMEFAVAIMLGTGGSAIVALKLGKEAKKEAKEDFTAITFVSAAIGTLFMVVCIPLLDPILKFLGTSAAQMPDCTIYTRVLLWFSPMYFLQVLFQMFFVTAGKPKLGLLFTVLGGILNIVLDYLFMGPLKMGIAGAAVATGIGYCVTAVAGLIYFTVKRKGTLYFSKLKFRKKTLIRTCTNGSSEMIGNLAVAVTTFLFNIIFMKFLGEDGVAAITIVSYFEFVLSAAFSGFSMGIAPVISYKYGAQDSKQLKKIVRFCVLFVAICSVAIYIISRATLPFSLAIFTEKGGTVYDIVLSGFPLYALSFLFMGINIFASSLFTSLNNGLVSGIISLARTFVFIIGSLLILPHLIGKTGVWLAVPVAEFLGLIVSISFMLWGRKKYKY